MEINWKISVVFVSPRVAIYSRVTDRKHVEVDVKQGEHF